VIWHGTDGDEPGQSWCGKPADDPSRLEVRTVRGDECQHCKRPNGKRTAPLALPPAPEAAPSREEDSAEDGGEPSPKRARAAEAGAAGAQRSGHAALLAPNVLLLSGACSTQQLHTHSSLRLIPSEQTRTTSAGLCIPPRVAWRSGAPHCERSVAAGVLTPSAAEQDQDGAHTFPRRAIVEVTSASSIGPVDPALVARLNIRHWLWLVTEGAPARLRNATARHSDQCENCDCGANPVEITGPRRSQSQSIAD